MVWGSPKPWWRGCRRRRDFIKVLAGSVAAWPLAARAQQPTMPMIGFMNAASAKAYARHLSAFLKGLGETGYVDGQNVAIEYRWAEGENDRHVLAVDVAGFAEPFEKGDRKSTRLNSSH